jgi:succinylglutamic semialdehyde dehydrogenase
MSLRQPLRSAAGDLLDGRFVVADRPDELLELRSPADLDDVIGRWPVQTAHAAEAVHAARRAFASWRRAPAESRAAHLRAYAKALGTHRDELCTAISRAIGKPLWESRTEVDAMIAKVDISLGTGLELVRTQAHPDLGGLVRYRPIGVAVVIGPFNFPGHLANGHIVPALATGNTVVFKPSERAPEVGEIMARCFVEAGFPAGVVQVVQGGAAMSKALLEQDDVDAVMFTGSTRTGSAILSQCARWPGRMVALELGGKNAAIVLADADLAYAAREIAFAAYVTAGQRCTATSRVIVERAAADALRAKLAVSARETRIGPPDGDDVFLGPVIDDATRDRALRTTAALADRYEAIVPARVPELSVRGHYLSPSLHALRPGAEPGALGCEELFAPVLTLEVVDSAEEAVARVNATRYGLAACVFTASRERFEALAPELDVGICNWNRGTVGSSSKLPFGGVKDSGNHRPAGLFSTYYCVDPVAELRVEQPKLGALAPGLRVGD